GPQDSTFLLRGGFAMAVLSGARPIHELAAAPSVSGLAGGVPNPAPKAPPGLTGPVNTLLAWWKWGALVAGVFGLIGCGAMMAIGRRNRSNLAADGATGIPWVLAGLPLFPFSAGFVGFFLGGGRHVQPLGLLAIPPLAPA